MRRIIELGLNLKMLIHSRGTAYNNYSWPFRLVFIINVDYVVTTMCRVRDGDAAPTA